MRLACAAPLILTSTKSKSKSTPHSRYLPLRMILVVQQVKIETGAEIMVPDFIKEGDFIKVDTIERKYLGRDNS